MIAAGNKVAKVVSGRFIKSPEKGTLGLELCFSFKEGAADERLYWVAWIGSPNLEYVQKSTNTLVNTLGFNGNDEVWTDPEKAGVLKDPKAFDWSREVQIVVELETYTNQAGEEKHKPRIAWVNALNRSSFTGCSPEVIKSDSALSGFRDALKAAKITGQKSKQTSAPQEEPSFTENDIPF